MKKLIILFLMTFLMSCNNGGDIKQKVDYDSISNTYSITTTFTYPKKYDACSYCTESQIDSVRLVEKKKAVLSQKEMLND